jgi:hypothetical protein
MTVKFRLRSLQAFVLPFLFACAASAAPLLVNPSFELGDGGDPLTGGIHVGSVYGWSSVGVETVQSGYGGYWTAAHGSYSVDLNGGYVSQTVTGLTPGMTYILTFSLSANPSWCSVPDSCEVAASIGGQSSLFTAGGTSMAWTDKSLLYIATGTSAPISFVATKSVGSGGPAIDYVRITEDVPAQVPEPSTMPAVALAFAACGAIMGFRRRRWA